MPKILVYLNLCNLECLAASTYVYIYFVIILSSDKTKVITSGLPRLQVKLQWDSEES